MTGLKYFGKTTCNNPEKYKGSGIYWKRHLKIHGYNVTTEIFGKYDDIELCEIAATKFSIENNITNSPLWANLQDENGKDGAPVNHVGHKFTNDQLKRISESSKARWADPEYRDKVIESHKERWTEELRAEQSKRLTGIKRPEHSAKMKGRTGHHNSIGIKKRPGHGENVSRATKGVPKSEEHKQKLRKPKARICRLTDQKEMSVNHYTRWLTSLARDSH